MSEICCFPVIWHRSQFLLVSSSMLSTLSSLRTLGCMPSGPADLLVFSLSSSPRISGLITLDILPRNQLWHWYVPQILNNGKRRNKFIQFLCIFPSSLSNPFIHLSSRGKAAPIAKFLLLMYLMKYLFVLTGRRFYIHTHI